MVDRRAFSLVLRYGILVFLLCTYIFTYHDHVVTLLIYNLNAWIFVIPFIYKILLSPYIFLNNYFESFSRYCKSIYISISGYTYTIYHSAHYTIQMLIFARFQLCVVFSCRNSSFYFSSTNHWLLPLSLTHSSAFTFIHSIFLILSLVSKVWERTTWRFSTTPNTPPHVILQLVVPCSAHLLSWAPLSFSAIEVATQNMPYIF